VYNLLRTVRAKHRTVLDVKMQPDGHVAFEGNVTAVKASEQSRQMMAKGTDIYKFFEPCFRAICLQEISKTLQIIQIPPYLPLQFPSHVTAMDACYSCPIWAR
jgi:hypothetical protein